MEEILKQLFGESVTGDVLKQFNTELGKKFVAKSDHNAKLEEIKTLKADKETLEGKITELTEKSNTADEYKQQLEDLQKQIKDEKDKAEADRLAKEKLQSIENRFNAAVGEKKFSHEAIQADYLKKFGEAIESKDFEGKSDADIFHELTKDDGAAFEGVTAFKLEGGANKGFGSEIDDAKVRAVMGLPVIN